MIMGFTSMRLVQEVQMWSGELFKNREGLLGDVSFVVWCMVNRW